MAKKKAVKKKSVKKKAGKKKAGKKKPTAKASHKKSGPKRRAAGAQVDEIRYRCASTCKANPKFANLAPGSTVDLVAENTDVRIDFQNGSPFVPATNRIDIPRGTTVRMTVGNFGPIPRHFDYLLTCANPKCRTSAANPEMIVP